jgi:hypothetical protein
MKEKMANHIAVLILLNINLTSCFAGSEVFNIVCETIVIQRDTGMWEKSGSKPIVNKYKKTISIDSLSGAILEGTIFENRNKEPNFYSKATEARFSGGIKSKIDGYIYQPKEIIFLAAYYTLDRFTGKLDAHLWIRQLDENAKVSRYGIEIKQEETGTCESSGERKF